MNYRIYLIELCKKQINDKFIRLSHRQLCDSYFYIGGDCLADIADKILKAIEIIIDKKLGQLGFDRTVDGKIVEKTEKGYLVAIEGGKINIKYNGCQAYSKENIVKICIPQNNIRQAYIVENNVKQQPETTTTELLKYDNNEICIGTWFGSTLYRKSFQIKSLYTGGSSWGLIGNLGRDMQIKSMESSWFDGSNYYVSGYGSWSLRYEPATGSLYVLNPSSNAYTFQDIKITVEYIHSYQ